MSETHDHPPRIRYTLYMTGWLGWPTKRVFYGVGSSVQGNELLIHAENGVFYSVNFARVRWMMAEVLTPVEGHSHT